MEHYDKVNRIIEPFTWYG